MLGWAVREGVTNVLRHSEAAVARIRVLSEPGVHAVEVVDDGRGDAVRDPEANPGSRSRAGVGLAGLRERAGRLGGSVEAGPLPGGGFRLRVTVPAEAAG
jgi:two-component system sensor histidine kinase DesK